MSRKVNTYKLFATAYLQVAFVAANTYMIANLNWIGIAVCSFMISLIWCMNVTSIAKSKTYEKLIYSAGAAAGSISGVWISMIIT